MNNRKNTVWQVIQNQFDVGARIEGNWKNYGTWYKGKITKQNADGTYDIVYDDGDSESNVKEENK